MEDIYEVSESLISKVSIEFRRYLFNIINWESRLIGIKGSRGTGKTTLLLQWLNLLKVPPREKLYLSLDDLYFTTNSLLDTAKTFYQLGGKFLILDEVHKYDGWSREIKNIYDRYTDLKIIFTGSSIIDITKNEGDLSRRAVMYELKGLSYREYLNLVTKQDFRPLSLSEILSDNLQLRKEFPEDFKPLSLFSEYLEYGYYPFAFEDRIEYHTRLKQLIRMIVEYDMAEIKGFDIRQAKKILQLLYIIAQEVPFKVNLQSLSNKANIHRNSISNYLYFLNEARLISLLYKPASGISLLQKPEKLFIDNSNLLIALTGRNNQIGTIREVFFNNQLNVIHAVNYSDKADFIIDNTYTFEIGGKTKSKKQIADMQSAWIVKDGIEFNAGSAVPLWVFGFLY